MVNLGGTQKERRYYSSAPIIAAGLLVLAVIFSGCVTPPVCPNNLCEQPSHDLNEIDSNSYYYCPMDCNFLVSNQTLIKPGTADANSMCKGTPANEDCSQFTAQNCLLFNAHGGKCGLNGSYCAGNAGCGENANAAACNNFGGEGKGVCTGGDTCTGILKCGEFKSKNACILGGGSETGAATDACTWSDDQSVCYNSGKSCEERITEGDCIVAESAGCSWEIKPCVEGNGCFMLKDPSACNSASGCGWLATSCTGNLSCGAQNTSEACAAIDGCDWEGN